MENEPQQYEVWRYLASGDFYEIVGVAEGKGDYGTLDGTRDATRIVVYRAWARRGGIHFRGISDFLTKFERRKP